MKCRLCNKDANQIGGAILVRVNEKGVKGIWECRPICGAEMDYGERLAAAIDGCFEPPTDEYADAIDEEDD